MQLTARDYQDALDVQDASNLSGVLYSFVEVLARITQDCREVRDELPSVVDLLSAALPRLRPLVWDTKKLNQHPVCQALGKRIGELTYCESGVVFNRAYAACKEAVARPLTDVIAEIETELHQVMTPTETVTPDSMEWRCKCGGSGITEGLLYDKVENLFRCPFCHSAQDWEPLTEVLKAELKDPAALAVAIEMSLDRR